MGENEKHLAFFLHCKKELEANGTGRFFDCPIWENIGKTCLKNRDVSKTPSVTWCWSPFAGGYFGLEGALNKTLDTLVCSKSAKITLSRWIAEQNIAGDKPLLTPDIVLQKLAQSPLTIDQRYFRLLKTHAIFCDQLSGGFSRGPADALVFYPNTTGYMSTGDLDLVGIAAAYSESTSEDFDWLLSSAIKNGDLEHERGVNRLTPKGLKEIQNLKKTTQSKQAFVAMWFDNTMTDVYNNAIKPAVDAAGYSAYRVDEDKSHSDQITNKILAEIKNSKFLIADFTHDRDGARGGVYFEAGYAMGLGIPVIWLIKKDDVSKMHFDTNHYPHIVWDSEEYLKDQLTDAIIAHQHIGKGSVRT